MQYRSSKRQDYTKALEDHPEETRRYDAIARLITQNDPCAAVFFDTTTNKIYVSFNEPNEEKIGEAKNIFWIFKHVINADEQALENVLDNDSKDVLNGMIHTALQKPEAIASIHADANLLPILEKDHALFADMNSKEQPSAGDGSTVTTTKQEQLEEIQTKIEGAKIGFEDFEKKIKAPSLSSLRKFRLELVEKLQGCNDDKQWEDFIAKTIRDVPKYPAEVKSFFDEFAALLGKDITEDSTKKVDSFIKQLREESSGAKEKAAAVTKALSDARQPLNNVLENVSKQIENNINPLNKLYKDAPLDEEKMQILAESQKTIEMIKKIQPELEQNIVEPKDLGNLLKRYEQVQEKTKQMSANIEQNAQDIITPFLKELNYEAQNAAQRSLEIQKNLAKLIYSYGEGEAKKWIETIKNALKSNSVFDSTFLESEESTPSIKWKYNGEQWTDPQAKEREEAFKKIMKDHKIPSDASTIGLIPEILDKVTKYKNAQEAVEKHNPYVENAKNWLVAQFSLSIPDVEAFKNAIDAYIPGQLLNDWAIFTQNRTNIESFLTAYPKPSEFQNYRELSKKKEELDTLINKIKRQSNNTTELIKEELQLYRDARSANNVDGMKKALSAIQDKISKARTKLADDITPLAKSVLIAAVTAKSATSVADITKTLQKAADDINDKAAADITKTLQKTAVNINDEKAVATVAQIIKDYGKVILSLNKKTFPESFLDAIKLGDSKIEFLEKSARDLSAIKVMDEDGQISAYAIKNDSKTDRYVERKDTNGSVLHKPLSDFTIHAEMQILQAIFDQTAKDLEETQQAHEFLKALQNRQPMYIGISKMCCHGCSATIQALNHLIGGENAIIYTRGEHWKASYWQEPQFVEALEAYTHHTAPQHNISFYDIIKGFGEAQRDGEKRSTDRSENSTSPLSRDSVKSNEKRQSFAESILTHKNKENQKDITKTRS